MKHIFFFPTILADLLEDTTCKHGIMKYFICEEDWWSQVFYIVLCKNLLIENKNQETDTGGEVAHNLTGNDILI